MEQNVQQNNTVQVWSQVACVGSFVGSILQFGVVRRRSEGHPSRISLELSLVDDSMLIISWGTSTGTLPKEDMQFFLLRNEWTSHLHIGYRYLRMMRSDEEAE
eukprot:scaffold62187_cov37-Attheya_sp.AAC.1